MEDQSWRRFEAAIHTPPRRVAFLIDHDVVSAGEAILLMVMRFSKVTLYGQNTNGTIDYQNVLITAVGAGRHRYGLGLPLVAASPSLPEKGLNATGIPPDVRIPEDEPDPAAFVRRQALPPP